MNVYQPSLDLWTEIFSSSLDRRILFEHLADPLLDRIPHLLLRRAADDALRLRLATLYHEAKFPDEYTDTALADKSADRLLDAIRRVEDRSDTDTSSAHAVYLLCTNRFAHAAVRAQSSLPPSLVLQAALLARGSSTLDPVVVLTLLSRGMVLKKALSAAALLASRSWWPSSLKDFALQEALRGRPLATLRDQLDFLGWAKLSSVQQTAALSMLKDPSHGFDGKTAALAARGVAFRSSR